MVDTPRTVPDTIIPAAEPATNRHTFTGDSGGRWCGGDTPLLSVSEPGIGCYREDGAGFYLRLDRNHFLDWIGRAMAADPSVSELR